MDSSKPRDNGSKNERFFVTEIDFTFCPCEPCLYYIYKNETLTLHILYVDDLLIASSSGKCINQVKKKLMDGFQMKDLGIASELLGIQIACN